MKNTLTFLALILSAFCFAQSKMPVCGTKTVYDAIYERTDLTQSEKEILIAAEESREEAFQRLISENRHKDGDTTIIVPVVFHIVHRYGPENVPNQTVYATLALLNREYNKQNPGVNNVVSMFKPLVADVNIEFRLATIDPNGQCTSGIIRHADEELSYCKSIECNKITKTKYTWPRDRYMNCFIVGTIETSGGGTVQGFSHFPFAPYSSADTIDSNAMIYSILPTSMTDARGINTSVTSHEVGHWLGLYHTWGKTDNVALPENCNDDDEVGDTPNCQGLRSVCDLSANTCDTEKPNDSIDNVQNYMDYSHCYAMFSVGQAARMRGVLQNLPHRKSVVTAQNLIATGVDSPAAPTVLCKANFMPNMDLEKFPICPGQSVSFSDLSFYTVKQRKWTFEGGTPATSTDSVPTVSYSQPGKYSVTLEVSDGTNTETTTQQQIVTVIDPAALGTSYTQGFESIDLNSTTDLEVNNPNNDQTFEVSSAVGYQSSRCLMVKNSLIPAERSDELISNTMDLSAKSGVLLSFDYAFAAKPGMTSTDQLTVWVSSNCGWTWAARKIIKGTALKTAADTDNDFYPASELEWKTTVVNLSSYNKKNVRFKLEWESGGGNNLFIDNINIDGAGSVDEISLLKNSMILFPNPSAGRLEVLFEAINVVPVTISVSTLSGQVIHSVQLTRTQPGENKLELDLEHLSKGMYLVSLSVGGNTATQKLSIQ